MVPAILSLAISVLGASGALIVLGASGALIDLLSRIRHHWQRIRARSKSIKAPLAPSYLQLEPGQRRAEAEMIAKSERDMGASILAMHIEKFAVLEFVFVAIC